MRKNPRLMRAHAVLLTGILAFTLLPSGIQAQSPGLYPTAATNADYDWLSDSEELTLGTNSALSDTDGDLISDSDELLVTGTNPLLADSDMDGLTDYEEWMATQTTLWDLNLNGLLDEDPLNRYGPEEELPSFEVGVEEGVWWMIAHLTDYDMDSLPDREEILYGNSNYFPYWRGYVTWPDGEGETYDSEIWGGPDHWQATDYDHDGLTAAEETTLGTNPYAPDTDGDGLLDGADYEHGDPLDTDTNLNGIDDHDELMYYGYSAQYFSSDLALATQLQNGLGSSPLGGLMDWDRDGMSNVWEIANGLNPVDALDAYDDPDGDFLMNIEEYQARTDPQVVLSPASLATTVMDIDPMTQEPVMRAAVNDCEAVTGKALPAALVRDNGPMTAFDYDDDWDGDGYSNMAELQFVPVKDPRVNSLDEDDDGLPDTWESQNGLDEDDGDENNNGIPDSNDDFDNDGLTNLQEITQGTQPMDADTDNDGLKDGWEVQYGLLPLFENQDYDLKLDGVDDFDNDGATNAQEQTAGTHPLQADTDGDGLKDGFEISKGLAPLSGDQDSDSVPDGTDDFDGDGLTNLQEQTAGTHPLQTDTDSDTLPDAWEVTHNLNGTSGDQNSNGIADADDDFDNDGLTNAQELAGNTHPLQVDTDGDGLPDGWEELKGLDNTDPDEDGNGTTDGEDDFDNDELMNQQEWEYGTHPLLADTDGDSLPDGWEISMGLDPLNPYGDDGANGDPDGDGISNLDEMLAGGNPNSVENPVDFELSIHTEDYSATLSQTDYTNPRDPDGNPTSESNYSKSFTSTRTVALNSAGFPEWVYDDSGEIAGPAPALSTLLNSVPKPVLTPYGVDGMIWGDYDWHRYTFTARSGPFPGGTGPSIWDSGSTSHTATRTVLKLVSDVSLPGGYKHKLYPFIIRSSTTSTVPTTYELKEPITLEIPKNSTASAVMEPYSSLNIGAVTNKEVKVRYLSVDLKQINVPNVGEPRNTTDLGNEYYSYRIIYEKGIAYITGEPVMPYLVARLGGFHEFNTEMNIDWKLEIKSERTKRGTRDNKFYPASGYRTLPADQEWNISDEFGTDFVGGKCKLYYKIGNTAEQTFEFYIRGKNPLDATAKDYVVNHAKSATYPYAWAIVQHESRQNTRCYNQFNSGGDGPGNLEQPNFTGPDGWGIAQLDKPLGVTASTNEVYHWRQNVEKFFLELDEKTAATGRFFDAVARTYPNDPEAANPPASFTAPGTATSYSARQLSTMILYNGAAGCPISSLKLSNGNTTGFQNPWTFDPNRTPKWQFTDNVNAYAYDVIHKEVDGADPFVE